MILHLQTRFFVFAQITGAESSRRFQRFVFCILFFLFLASVIPHEYRGSRALFSQNTGLVVLLSGESDILRASSTGLFAQITGAIHRPDGYSYKSRVNKS